MLWIDLAPIKMIFEDVVEAIKPFGLYQKRMYFLISLTGIPAALHTMVTVFILASPDHRSDYDVMPVTSLLLSSFVCLVWTKKAHTQSSVINPIYLLLERRPCLWGK